ncbi:MAG: peptide chain release factor 2 [Bacilli bacterium]|jgi:peptide chain release factor 2|nr:peptide chain release factor 2 [Bacilli bacterium]
MDLFEIKKALQVIQNELHNFISLTTKEELVIKKRSLEEATMQNNFYSNKDNVRQVTSELRQLNELLNLVDKTNKEVLDLNELLSMDYNDIVEMEEDIINEYQQLNEDYQQLKILMLLNDEYDSNDALLEIHSGAGGTESQDWVEMLYKMYLNYAKKKSFKISVLDASYANDVGIKSIVLKIQGSYAYGLLKNERGVHRLIRISPFDSNKRRHTTFALVSISPILEQIDKISIDEKDLVIDTYRSSGAGGQSVNTTDSAIRITHVPSGIVVTCQNERSQLLNKKEALSVLESKLLQLEIDKQNELKRSLKGDVVDINFGSQIRSYIFHPYQMVKDHRSKYENSNPEALLSGNLDDVIASVLQYSKER